LKNSVGLFFLLLVALINIIYACIYLDFEFIINTSYWLYGGILFLVFIIVARNKSVMFWIRRLISIQLGFVVLAYFTGLGGYTFWPRYEYFFNGPNQLAYFSICLFLVYFAICNCRLNLELYLVIALTVFIVLTTGSRSAYLSMIPLFLLIMWSERSSMINLTGLAIIPLAIFIFFNQFNFPLYKPMLDVNQLSAPLDKTISIVNQKVSSSTSVLKKTIARTDQLNTKKQESDVNSIHVQLLARGYFRILDHPQYLLFGSGQGKDDRFNQYQGAADEIHNSLLAVFFYYGLLGLILFSLFIWKLFEHKKNLLFMTPLFVYGLFTYGLRSPYFWLALSFIALMPDLFKSEKVILDASVK
jgi:hypothetical protein